MTKPKSQSKSQPSSSAEQPTSREIAAAEAAAEIADFGTRTDPKVARAIATWFATAARDLPWRHVEPKTSSRDPYRSLVSEIMLQQTQVSRVLEHFEPFLEKFPTVHSLAQADEHDVLAAWTGLGYYRRARSLHAAAKRIVDVHKGSVPSDVERLMELPGVGRYTAGAIASIVYGKEEPIVDGNVVRVLFRIHGVDRPADDARGVDWAWEESKRMVALAPPGQLNEGLMELGATVCTPANPNCEECPVRSQCKAHAAGTQNQIPGAKGAARKREQWHVCVVVRDVNLQYLMERRTGGTLWQGLWQVPTIEQDGPWSETKSKLKEMAQRVVDRLNVGAVLTGTMREPFDFETTACTVRFRIFEAKVQAIAPKCAVATWHAPFEAKQLPLSSPMKKLLGVEDAPRSRRR
jgi:A/G-specific adenine glycosylase